MSTSCHRVTSGRCTRGKKPPHTVRDIKLQPCCHCVILYTLHAVSQSDTALMLDAVRTAYEAIQKTRNLAQPSRGRSQFNINCRLDRPHPSPVGDRIMDSIRKVCAFVSHVSPPPPSPLIGLFDWFGFGHCKFLPLCFFFLPCFPSTLVSILHGLLGCTFIFLPYI